jgi:hypothetical protein
MRLITTKLGRGYTALVVHHNSVTEVNGVNFQIVVRRALNYAMSEKTRLDYKTIRAERQPNRVLEPSIQKEV